MKLKFVCNLFQVPSFTSTPRNAIEGALDSVSTIPDPTVPSESSILNKNSEFAQTLDSSTPTLPSGSSTSCTQTRCLFCSNIQKRSGKRKLNLIFPQSENILQQIKTTAETLNDSQILSKLENQTIVYHTTCFSSYQIQLKRHTEVHVDSSWHENRELHKLAFDSLVDFITREIIENNKVMCLTQLFSRYQALLLEFAEGKMDPDDDMALYRSDYLENKILKRFGDRLTIEASDGPRYKKIVYKTDIDVSVMANNTKFLETKEDNKFEDVAYYLRNCIKIIDRKQLPSHLTADDVIHGECEIPEKLFEFMYTILSLDPTFLVMIQTTPQ